MTFATYRDAVRNRAGRRGHEALAFSLESAFAVAPGSVRKGLADIAVRR